MADVATEYQKEILKKILFKGCRLEIIKQRNGTYKHYLTGRGVFEIIRNDTSKALRNYFLSRVTFKKQSNDTH